MILNGLDLPAQLVMLDLVSIAAALGAGYYATKMFYHMRRGRLERGWNWMIFGALTIAIGYFFLTVEDFFLAYSFYYVSVDYIGTVTCTAGLVILMFGIRAHYSAWLPSWSSKIGISANSKKEQNGKKITDTS